MDRPFYVTLPTTGTHKYIKGYQYRDYGNYIADREVKFPFDVYRGSSTNGTFIRKDRFFSKGSSYCNRRNGGNAVKDYISSGTH